MAILLMLLFGIIGGAISAFFSDGLQLSSDILIGMVIGVLVDIAFTLKRLFYKLTDEREEA